MTEADVEHLLRGCEIMGTGGGGSAAFGEAILRNDLRRGRSYELVSLSDVPDEALVVSGGIMGSVKVLDRFSPDEIVAQWEERFELLAALRAMEAHLGRKVDYVVPFEVGALNTPVIMSLAARAGIPMIDGDGVGRSAPETQMTSFMGHGVSLVPMPLVDWKGNVIVVDKAVTPFFPDEVGRFVVTQAGGLGANTHYPMDGRAARRAVVPDTISAAIHLGRKLSDTHDPDEVAARVAEHVAGRVAFRGAVRSLVEENALGFLVQTAVIDGADRWAGSAMEIVMKNEFMMASKDGAVGCIFPDPILLIGQSGRGVMSSELAVGDPVRVVVAPCHPRLREAMTSEIGQQALGSARFGRPGHAYVPVETQSASWGLAWPKS